MPNPKRKFAKLSHWNFNIAYVLFQYNKYNGLARKGTKGFTFYTMYLIFLTETEKKPILTDLFIIIVDDTLMIIIEANTNITRLTILIK